MLRKTYLTGLVLLAISTPCLSAGFYVGAGLGPDHVDFGQNSHVYQISNNFNVIFQTHLSGLGVFGNVFAGYGGDYRKLYLAGEVNAETNSIVSTSTNSEFVHKNYSYSNLRMHPVFGISFIPGYHYSDKTLFYARFGYAAGNFKSNTSDISLKNENKYLSGFRFGAGIKESLTEHVSFRMEYSQVEYQDTSFSTFDPVGGVEKVTSYRPQTQQVEFGLVYDFA